MPVPGVRSQLSAASPDMHVAWPLAPLCRADRLRELALAQSSSCGGSSLLSGSGCIDADHTRGLLAQDSVQGRGGLASPPGTCEQQALPPGQRREGVHGLCKARSAVLPICAHPAKVPR